MKITTSAETPHRHLTKERSAPAPAIAQLIVKFGHIVGFSPESDPLVDFPANRTGFLLSARSVVALTRESVGAEAVLAFEDGDLSRPVILGLLQTPNVDRTQCGAAAAPTEPLEVVSDGNHLILSAEKEVVLRCGLASITLTRAGKVLIRGEYLLSRSTGANRIKGGSVQIN